MSEMQRPRHGSLFAGLGGFELAFSRCGAQPVWSVEIDPQCRNVLSRHFPDTALFEDVQDVGAHNLEPVDVMTFGSPCQDLSVAGNQAGLKGERSGLFFEAIRIVGELKPALVLFENVPGLLSSNAGRDFASVLMAFRELGARDIAWRTLDAQYAGVPQRRRRIFLVADFAGERAASILFEPESVQGYPPTRREAGQRTAAGVVKGAAIGRRPENGPQRGEWLEDDTCYTLNATEVHAVSVNLEGESSDAALTATGVGTCGADDNQAQAGHLIAGPLTSRYGKGVNSTVDDGAVVPFLSHALTAEGSDASEDGTGRGVPIIVSLRGREGGVSAELGGEQANALTSGDAAGYKAHVLIPFDTTQITSGLNRSSPQEGDPSHPLAAQGHAPAIAFSSKDHGADALDDVAPTLRSMNFDKSHMNGGGQVAVAIVPMAVRRLTPLECERLQGYPDSWSAYGADGKAMSDSFRYRALGNSIAVPVVEWIARRMVALL